MSEDWRNGGFGLYIHWPFCQAKCPYCDFNSHVSANIDQRRWRDAYLRELDRYASFTGDRILQSVFFGGGTPSLMDPDTVAAIIDRIRRNWRTSNDLEITLEANPTSVEASRFAGYHAAGVNRVSLGLQALNDADLKALGRLHSVEEGRTAFEIARKQFDRVSFDLIYARQSQTPGAWRSELTEALAMAADHLSLYQLTIEPGTAFGDRYSRGRLRGLPSEDAAADMYEITQDLCGTAGLPAYEVSNHAAEGAESRHNLIYWHYGDYIGIGPGAHGRVTRNGERHAVEAARQPGAWLTSVERDATAETWSRLAEQEQAQEYLLMGMRVNDGVDLARYEAIFGAAPPLEAIAELSEMGFVETDMGRLRTTPKGRPLLNAILGRLLAH